MANSIMKNVTTAYGYYFNWGFYFSAGYYYCTKKFNKHFHNEFKNYTPFCI